MLGFSFRTRRDSLRHGVQRLLRVCTGVSVDISGRIFITVLGRCTTRMNGRFLPSICPLVRGSFGNSCRTCMSSLCTHSSLRAPRKFRRIIGKSAACILFSSPTTSFTVSVLIGFCRFGRSIRRTDVGVRGGRHLLGRTVHRVRTSEIFCPSTGSAVHLDFNVINNCSPGSTVRCSCFAAAGNVFSGVERCGKSDSFSILPSMIRYLEEGSFKHCTAKSNGVGIYFVSSGSVAKKGSNDKVFGKGKRLVNLTFSKG